MARTRLYRHAVLVREDFPPEDISEHLADPDAFVWLDYCRPSEQNLATIEEELSLHTLAVEDAVTEHERPKLDRYDSHLYISAYAVTLDRASGALSTTELGAFVTAQALVTIRKDEGYDIESVVARWDESAEMAQHGVAFLLWGLLDDIVDGHFAVVQALDNEIDGLEDLLFDDRPHDADVQRRSFELRKSLVRVRRVVLPMREMVNFAHAPRPARPRRGNGPLLPRRLRPRAARHGMDRVPARHGFHHPRNQPHDPGQPYEPRDEEGNQLGGNHRRSDGCHRLLRAERTVPRLCRPRRILGFDRARYRVVRPAVSDVPASRLALTLTRSRADKGSSGPRRPNGSPGPTRPRAQRAAHPARTVSRPRSLYNT